MTRYHVSEYKCAEGYPSPVSELLCTRVYGGAYSWAAPAENTRFTVWMNIFEIL